MPCPLSQGELPCWLRLHGDLLLQAWPHAGAHSALQHPSLRSCYSWEGALHAYLTARHLIGTQAQRLQAAVQMLLQAADYATALLGYQAAFSMPCLYN